MLLKKLFKNHDFNIESLLFKIYKELGLDFSCHDTEDWVKKIENRVIAFFIAFLSLHKIYCLLLISCRNIFVMYSNIPRMVRDKSNNMRFMKNNSNLLVTLIFMSDFSDNAQRVFVEYEVD